MNEQDILLVKRKFLEVELLNKSIENKISPSVGVYQSSVSAISEQIDSVNELMEVPYVPPIFEEPVLPEENML